MADFSYFLPFCIILNLVEGRIELHQTLQVLARSFYPCYLLLLCRYLAIKSKKITNYSRFLSKTFGDSEIMSIFAPREPAKPLYNA